MINRVGIFLFFAFAHFNVIAQGNELNRYSDRLITITVLGLGSSLESSSLDADREVSSVLFNFFNKTNGALIKNNTQAVDSAEIFRTCVSQSEVLSKYEISAQQYFVIKKITFSINKLISFFQAKGYQFQFEGGSFAVMVREQTLNESLETNSIWKILFTLSPYLFQSFNFKVAKGIPQAVGEQNALWRLDYNVTVETSSYIGLVFYVLKDVLNTFSLSSDEQSAYKKINKSSYQFAVDDKNYILRRVESINALNLFFKDFTPAMRHFVINDGVSSYFGHYLKKDFDQSCFYAKNAIFNCSKNNKDEHVQILNCGRDTHDGPYSGFEKFSRSDVFTLSNIPNSYTSTMTSGVYLRDYSFSIYYTTEDISKIDTVKVEGLYKYTKWGTWYEGGRIFFDKGDSAILICPIDPKINTYYKGVNLSQNESDYLSELSRLKTDTSLGSGRYNTELLKNTYGTRKFPFWEYADYSFFGFSNWHLPSKNEMEYLLESYILLFNELPIVAKDCPSEHCGVRDFLTSSTVPFQPGFFSISNSYSIYGASAVRQGNGNKSGVKTLSSTSDGYVRIIPIRSTYPFNSSSIPKGQDVIRSNNLSKLKDSISILLTELKKNPIPSKYKLVGDLNFNYLTFKNMWFGDLLHLVFVDSKNKEFDFNKDLTKSDLYVEASSPSTENGGYMPNKKYVGKKFLVVWRRLKLKNKPTNEAEMYYEEFDEIIYIKLVK